MPDVFILSRPHGTVRASGTQELFTDAAAASDALRAGRIDALTGAIGFDATETAALTAPKNMLHSTRPLAGRPALSARVTDKTLLPDRAEHRDRVGHAIKRIAAGDLNKVVLARAVDLVVDSEINPVELLHALAGGNPEHNAFSVDLGTGSILLGASPELLLRKRGREVTCLPYAGSAPRSTDPDTDRATAATLARSSKDHSEHAFVVDYLREQLSTLCDDVDAPAQPQVLSTREVWHLATPIRATIRDPAITSLDLALLLGPTPAVCGTPSDVAAQIIGEVEGDRGFYAGSVGWCDADGDGEWMVTIRCLQLAPDRRRLRTWAGGGIVAESDPQTELEETGFKLRTVLNALGVADLGD